MAKSFVYFIVAALLFAVHSTTAFTLNIDDKLGEAERLDFGLEYSDPKYFVFPMSLTGMAHKQKARKNITCTLVLNAETVKLNLKPTSQYLATKYIPVWSADSDPNAYNNIRYTPMTRAMSDIGEFTMYHDLENKAALVVYKDRFEKIVIEGIISSYYVIRSLPKRFIGEFLNVVDDISKIPDMMGGPITSNEDAGLFAVINVPRGMTGLHFRDFIEIDVRLKRAKSNEDNRQVPKEIYPEFLVVLDHNALRYRTITRALRFTLAFWNAIDMLVHLISKPKIRPNIAGIIVAMDDKATPYITEDTSIRSIDNLNSVASKVQEYFYEERYRFPVEKYDIIVPMTTMTLCPGKEYSCPYYHSVHVYGIPSLNCSSKRAITRAKAVENVLIMHYDANIGPVELFMFEYFIKDIPQCSLSPAKCDERIYSSFFKFKETKCYRNKPLSIKPVDKVMSGTWLSIDGQCQNEGFAKSCKLKKEKRRCMIKDCWSKGSKKCVRSKQVPLLGSKCGTNKHCNKNKKCV